MFKIGKEVGRSGVTFIMERKVFLDLFELFLPHVRGIGDNDVKSSFAENLAKIDIPDHWKVVRECVVRG